MNGRACKPAADSVEKLTALLADAQVDLNPHQIEAALFAFRSPFSKVLLAATPLQNSLLELYGLVSMIVEFGGLGLRMRILWDTFSI